MQGLLTKDYDITALGEMTQAENNIQPTLRIRSRIRLRDASIHMSDFLRKFTRPTRSGKRIIVFHEVRDEALFREKIGWLLSHYELLSLEQLLNGPVGQKTQVAITFDDGYASWHEIAAPVLEEFSVPAVFHVCSGYIGLQGDKAEHFKRIYIRRERELYPLSRRQLLDLSKNPLFEIGSHTVHHTDLGNPPDESTLRAEIEVDRSRLEDWTGMHIRWFAYPFGAPWNISTEAVDFVRRAGFLAAFSLTPGYWKPGSDRWKIARDGLDISASPNLWRAWLDGSYDALYGVKAKGLKIGRKLSGTRR